jgi:hypothetical protein
MKSFVSLYLFWHTSDLTLFSEWRNGIAKHFSQYLKLYDPERTEADFAIFDKNPLVFFIVIRAQLYPIIKHNPNDPKSKTEEENFEIARKILTRDSVLCHIFERGKPHKETCLNHAYLIEQPMLARLIVKLDKRLHASSYRGKVSCVFPFLLTGCCFDQLSGLLW